MKKLFITVGIFIALVLLVILSGRVTSISNFQKDAFINQNLGEYELVPNYAYILNPLHPPEIHDEYYLQNNASNTTVAVSIQPNNGIAPSVLINNGLGTPAYTQSGNVIWFKQCPCASPLEHEETYFSVSWISAQASISIENYLLGDQTYGSAQQSIVNAYLQKYPSVLSENGVTGPDISTFDPNAGLQIINQSIAGYSVEPQNFYSSGDALYTRSDASTTALVVMTAIPPNETTPSHMIPATSSLEVSTKEFAGNKVIEAQGLTLVASGDGRTFKAIPFYEFDWFSSQYDIYMVFESSFGANEESFLETYLQKYPSIL